MARSAPVNPRNRQMWKESFVQPRNVKKKKKSSNNIELTYPEIA